MAILEPISHNAALEASSRIQRCERKFCTVSARGGFLLSFGGPQMLDKPLMRADAATVRRMRESGARSKIHSACARCGVPRVTERLRSFAATLDAPLAACLGAARVAVGPDRVCFKRLERQLSTRVAAGR
jgi:hypothetical protein